MKETIYAIQMNLKGEVLYMNFDRAIGLVKKKSEATLFKSRMLAYGWLVKAKITFPTYKFTVIIL